jgi:membrane protein required for colicin V production
MDSLPLNILDLGLIVVLVLAGLIGLSLGFVRGGLFVISWIGAILATLYGFAFARPYARAYIETTWIADLAAGVALFLVSLIVLTVISHWIAALVRGSSLNALDRSLGMLAGIGTAVLLVCLVYGALENVWPPEEQPAWAREAKAMPIIERGAAIVMSLVPEDAASSGAKAAREAEERARKALEAQDAVRELLEPPTRTPADAAAGGYSAEQRQKMDRLIEGSQ